jgi:SAM-dependent methyltransferase
MTNPEFPKNACAYEVYDPVTLVPGNESTFVRLMELGWTETEFRGRRVLDIGANTGILSIRAHQLGASSVQAVDVQAPLVEFFARVAARHKLPVTVERRGFAQLDAAKDAADIVLFMEVLHWIVDQGGNVPDTIAKLASLTHDTLYLETPWDIGEPSIASKGIISEERYNIELILRELSRHFTDVKVVRFMTYFGRMAGSKRVLLRASGRRGASLPVSEAGELNLLDVALIRGANAIELVTTPKGPMVLKRIHPDCTLGRLDASAIETLCAYLAGLKMPTVVPPARIGRTFRHRAEDGGLYMLFPFVGVLGDFFPRRRAPKAVASPLDVAVRLRQDLRGVPETLVAAVRRAQRPTPVGDPGGLPPLVLAALAEAGVLDACKRACEKAGTADPGREDCLIHNDMQTGNMVLNAAGEAHVVDIDIMHTGTAYQDVIACGIYSGAAPEQLAAAVFQLAQLETRAAEAFDFDISIACTVSWLKAISSSASGIPDRQLEKYVTGLKAAITLHDQLGALQ